MAEPNQPVPLPEGETDFSSPLDMYNILGVEKIDIRAMKGTGLGESAGYLTDSGIRAILLDSMKNFSVSPSTVLFDPAWLSQWMNISENKRLDQCWKAFPRPLHKTAGVPVELIVIPFNIHNYHWVLMVFDIPKTRLLIYDSGKEIFPNLAVTDAAMRFGEIFSPYLGGADWWAEYQVIQPDVLQQSDGTSCGIHTTLNTLAILQGIDPVEQYPDNHGMLDIKGYRKTWTETLKALENGEKKI